jgi:hypothetical protein
LTARSDFWAEAPALLRRAQGSRRLGASCVAAARRFWKLRAATPGGAARNQFVRAALAAEPTEAASSRRKGA